MPFKKVALLLLFFFIIAPIFGQDSLYTSANAHSHNDYKQHRPFHQAYKNEFGSIEADVYLTDNVLLVGHSSLKLKKHKTLESMYLVPLSNLIDENNGFVYKDQTKKLQLLIDLKTESISTLNALIDLLKKFPSITFNKSITIVITGNQPNSSAFIDYPDYIWFDGRLNQKYSEAALSKIAVLSNNFKRYCKLKGIDSLSEMEKNKIESKVIFAHLLHKPVRFWASPDYPQIWKELIKLKVDYINTDHIEYLSSFLLNK